MPSKCFQSKLLHPTWDISPGLGDFFIFIGSAAHQFVATGTVSSACPLPKRSLTNKNSGTSQSPNFFSQPLTEYSTRGPRDLLCHTLAEWCWGTLGPPWGPAEQQNWQQITFQLMQQELSEHMVSKPWLSFAPKVNILKVSFMSYIYPQSCWPEPWVPDFGKYLIFTNLWNNAAKPKQRRQAAFSSSVTGSEHRGKTFNQFRRIWVWRFMCY